MLPALLATLLACGGEGTPAPPVIGAFEDTGCPSTDEALARTREALGITNDDEVPGALDELRPELVRILIDDGGLRVVFQGVTALVDDVDRVTVERLLSGIDPEQGLGGLTPHIVQVLRFIDGSSAFDPQPHLEPIAAVHDVLLECDTAATLSTVRGLLLLEVKDGPGGPTLAAAGEGDRVWLNAVLDDARALLSDPALRELLEQIELEDPDGTPGDPDSIRVGRDAFLLLAKLLAGNLAAPDFDPAFTRELLEDVLLSRVDDAAARARVNALLDLVLLVTDPSADVFPQVQSFMQCVNGADAEAAIPGLLFDWLTIEELSVDGFLEDVSSSTSGEAPASLRLALLDLLGALETRPVIANDVSRVLAAFLDDRVGPMVVRAALKLQGTGMLAEVTRLAGVVAECQETP